jgi:hypothetical protein
MSWPAGFWIEPAILASQLCKRICNIATTSGGTWNTDNKRLHTCNTADSQKSQEKERGRKTKLGVCVVFMFLVDSQYILLILLVPKRF